MEIKPGDLVMVVKPRPCCGYPSRYGFPFTVTLIEETMTICDACGETWTSLQAYEPNGTLCDVSRLKKIDPPASGDSLPTRADLKLEA